MSSEKSFFDLGNLLPGAVEPAEDRLLQGYLVSYPETQTYRHYSSYFEQLSINKAKSPLNIESNALIFGAWQRIPSFFMAFKTFNISVGCRFPTEKLHCCIFL